MEMGRALGEYLWVDMVMHVDFRHVEMVVQMLDLVMNGCSTTGL
jgi:hypothetical protein